MRGTRVYIRSIHRRTIKSSAKISDKFSYKNMYELAPARISCFEYIDVHDTPYIFNERLDRRVGINAANAFYSAPALKLISGMTSFHYEIKREKI